MWMWLLALPPTVKLGATLLAVVALIRARLPMWLAFMAGGLALAGFFPMTTGDYARAVLRGATGEPTLFLICVVSSILVFSRALDETDQVTRIIEAFRSLMGASRVTLVLFPVLVGLLPMPGGAIFSAPMVEAAARGSSITAEGKTLANYWFRHLWEYWLPIYPGVILSLTLTRAPIGLYILMFLPMSVVALLAGWALLLRGTRLEGPRHRNYSRANLGRLGREMLPYLIVIGATVALGPLAEALADGLIAAGRIAERGIFLVRWPILLGLAVAFGWLIRFRALAPRRLARLFFTSHVAQMVATVVSIMILQVVLNQCGAVEALRAEFEARQAPLPVVVAALPFIAGLTVGIGIGFVAASFPLVLPLLDGLAPEARMPWFFLAYAMGYMGMMLSPVHICLLLTNEYFGARLTRTYLGLAGIAAVTTAATWGLFFFYRMMF